MPVVLDRSKLRSHNNKPVQIGARSRKRVSRSEPDGDTIKMVATLIGLVFIFLFLARYTGLI